MKFAAVLATSAVASASALKEVSLIPGYGQPNVLSVIPGFAAAKAYSAVDLNVLHGMIDDNHCEELYIPTESFDKFMAADGWKYPTYTDGICPAPYTTYDAKTADTDFPEVTHQKRGVGDTAATISFSNCGPSSFTFSAGAVVKGSTVKITGTGPVSGITSGSYSVKADYGSISLVNQQSDLSKPMDVDIKVLLTDFGHMTATPFALPASGTVSIEIEMPVPNIGGTVTGTTTGSNQLGLPIWCMDMTLNL